MREQWHCLTANAQSLPLAHSQADFLSNYINYYLSMSCMNYQNTFMHTIHVSFSAFIKSLKALATAAVKLYKSSDRQNT